MANLFANCKLVDGEEKEVDAASLFGEGKVLGMYFSAHWCPPCRAFTPQLATWYNKFKKGSPNGDKLELVFVSSDRDKDSFKEYYKEMPWLALSYEDREKKGELSKKYKVSGIPTLVLLNGEGALVTTDGRSIVMDDPEGKDYPWKPKQFGDIIPGKLVNKEGEETSWSQVKEDYVGLYFSAHWCGPCRAFTPQLVKTYEAIRGAGKSFQIIFVSSDRDEDSMKEYLGEMPWLAIPHGDSRKKALSRLFDVSGIPTFVVMKRDGEVITSSGRGAVSEDPDGKDFPWFPKPVNSLKASTASNINDEAGLIWFVEDEPDKARDILTPIATKHQAEVKKSGAETLLFYYHCEDEDEDEIGKSLKSFCNLSPEDKLVLIDIPNQKVYVHDSKSDINADVIEKVASNYRSGSLELRGLKS